MSVHFDEMPPAMMPKAFDHLEMAIVATVVVGSISRVRLRSAEMLDLEWTWFVVMNGDFRAGRAWTIDEARVHVRGAVRALGGGSTE